MAHIESPLPTMAPTATPKNMSNRLMTMKFMQRGAASATSSVASTPETYNEGSAKRRKTAHKHTPEAKPLYDEKAVQAALEEEERKRQAAIAKRAQELGDEHWVLNGAKVSSLSTKQHVTLNVVHVGFAQIDSGFGGEDERSGSNNVTELAGRRQFNMKKKKKNAAKSESDSDSDTSSSGDGSDSGASSSRGRQPESTPSGNRKRHRSSVSKKREAERAKAQELAEKRRKKEVKLNTLTSLSSGGASTSSFGRKPGGQTSSMKCYTCGKVGHLSKSCPFPRKSR